MSTAKVWRYEVSHPEHGTTVVESVGPESAVMAACKRWGEDWGSTAGYCRCTKLGTAAKPRCKRCHKEYGEAGEPSALCPDCLEIEERYRRDRGRFLAERGRVDRRVSDE